MPAGVEQLMRQRENARKSKHFRLADEIRERLSAQGYVIDDLPAGSRIKRKK